MNQKLRRVFLESSFSLPSQSVIARTFPFLQALLHFYMYLILISAITVLIQFCTVYLIVHCRTKLLTSSLACTILQTLSKDICLIYKFNFVTFLLETSYHILTVYRFQTLRHAMKRNSLALFLGMFIHKWPSSQNKLRNPHRPSEHPDNFHILLQTSPGFQSSWILSISQVPL